MPSAICLYTHFNRLDDMVAGQLSRRYPKNCIIQEWKLIHTKYRGYFVGMTFDLLDSEFFGSQRSMGERGILVHVIIGGHVWGIIGQFQKFPSNVLLLKE